MKATRWDDVLFGSERVRRRKSTTGGSDESLFSFLLEMEDQLRLGLNDEPKQKPDRYNSSSLDELERLTRRSLSRYIE
jgi:hypothetical protein